MQCILVTPTPSHQHRWDNVSSVKAATETGALVILPGHVPFFATGNASPLRVMLDNGQEEIFALLKPTYRIEKTATNETIVTISAQQAFWKETDVHLSIQAYAEQLQDMLKLDDLSSFEKVYIEDEIVGTQSLLGKAKI